MPTQAKPIPQGYHSVTPYLTLNNTASAIDFYKRAFGAQEIMRMDMPGGKIGHAEIRIGDSMIMLADEMPGGGCQSPQSVHGTTAGVFLYVEDVDAVFNQAVSAGAQAEMQPADMFWGDRYGQVEDPFGHKWSLATHTRDLTEAQIKDGMARMVAEMKPGDCG